MDVLEASQKPPKEGARPLAHGVVEKTLTSLQSDMAKEVGRVRRNLEVLARLPRLPKDGAQVDMFHAEMLAALLLAGRVAEVRVACFFTNDPAR